MEDFVNNCLKPDIKFRYSNTDENKIFDWKEENVLEKKDILNRLNRYDVLLSHERRVIDAMIDRFAHEIKNADNEELKNALIRISHEEIKIRKYDYTQKESDLND